MNQHYFIAGTAAGVGKSYVINALLRSFQEAGVKAAGFKPITCGDRSEVRQMREAMQEPTLSLELLNPVYLRAATDPLMAADLERKSIDIETIHRSWVELSSAYQVVLTEGVYGWLTPIAPGLTMADVAKKMGSPVILVADNTRGAAGQVALTHQAIQNAGLKCAGVILNHASAEWDTAAVTNADLIERTTGLPILASLIQGDELDCSCLD